MRRLEFDQFLSKIKAKRTPKPLDWPGIKEQQVVRCDANEDMDRIPDLLNSLAR